MNLPSYVLLIALAGTTLPAQFYEPEFDVPWLGYDINVYPKAIEIWDVAQGDFDADGTPDLAAVSWYPNPELSVLFGDGGGGFFPPQRYPLALGSLGVEAADIDRDGDLDLLVCDTGQRWEGASFSVFRNGGARVFTAAGSFPCGQGPSGITTGDFDGDGVLDVAVAHDKYIVPGVSIAVVLGTGLGAFATPTILPMPSGTYDIEAGDLDGDGRVDLVVGHENRRVSVLRNTGGGNFAAPVILTPDPLGSLFREPDVLLADVDGDGDLDVLFSGAGAVNTGIGFVDLFRNQGAGVFAAPQPIPLGGGMDGAAGLHLRDLDRDGVKDLLAASGAGEWALLRGDGAGFFHPARVFRAGDEPFRFATGDLDGDADPDVVVIARASMEACVYRNDGHAGFVQPAAEPLVDPSLAPVSSSHTVVIDIDGDGDADFVTGYSANFVSRTGITVRRGRGDGTLGPIEDYLTPLFPSSLVAGDVSGDGAPDLVWLETTFGVGTPVLQMKVNDGTGGFGPTRTIGVRARGGDDGALLLGDVDGDRDLDVIATGTLFDVLVYRNLGGGVFAAPLVHVVGGVVSALGVGDFDRDGDLDLATNTAAQGCFEISLNTGGGVFAAPFPETSGRGVRAIAVADVSGDGIADLCGGYDLDGDGATVLVGRGDGTFRPARNHHGTYSGSTRHIAVADLDADGWLDLFAANFTAQDVSYWRNSAGALFEDLRRYGVGHPVRSVAHTDFDGDGVGDLVAQVEPPSPTNGWYYPALTVLRGKARGISDLGYPLPGARGAPRLLGVGLLVPGQTISFELRNAARAVPAAWVLGTARLDLPWFGGLLIPQPQVVLPFRTDQEGGGRWPLTWPRGLLAGTAFHLQAWIVDASAVAGLAASNGLRAVRL